MIDSLTLKTVKNHFQRGSNILRKLFMTQASARGVKVEGNSLNGGALVRSFISARKCRDNHDRYITQVRKPQSRCAFSFAIDFSGSMNAPATRKHDSFLGHASSWERVIATIHGMTNVAETIGIKSKVGFIQFGQDKEFMVNVIKDFEQKSWSDEQASKVSNLRCDDGTDISLYARASIYMLESIEAEHKVAFFLTDGCDYSFQYYARSLNELAKSKGIKLVGIAFADKSTDVSYFPNGVACTDVKELGQVIYKHLESLMG